MEPGFNHFSKTLTGQYVTDHMLGLFDRTVLGQDQLWIIGFNTFFFYSYWASDSSEENLAETLSGTRLEREPHHADKG